MIFHFHPQRNDKKLALRMAGDVLEINGQDFDFSSVEEGDTLPTTAIKSEWIAGPVTRKNGELSINLLLPIGPNATGNFRFPAVLKKDINGPVDLEKIRRVGQ